MPETEKSILRFTTTGSVDDGKSTLIGRLLWETRSIYEDQYEAIERTSRRKGLPDVDLALLLDGLSAEREQGITIDVAYRYFETARRKFIIADTPGHVQYTRNMVTGASTADCAIVLIDARNGVLTQSRRHGFIASLLQIPRLVVAVNKMDLVGYSEEVFNAIAREYREFSEKLEMHDVVFMPVSALRGDNVVEKSASMPWYDGATLLHYLENIHVSADRNLIDFRFPVQYVIRPHLDFRGFAGKVVSGTVTPGEEVTVLPSARTTRVKSLVTFDGELREAFTPQSVVMTLEDEVDVSRGDMIVRKNNLPTVGSRFEAMLCWMDEAALSPTESYVLRHTTRYLKARVSRVFYRINMNNLHREPAETFTLNEIGRVEITASQPLFFDVYKANRATGSFVLIDPLTNNTVAAGVIRGISRTVEDVKRIAEGTDKRSGGPARGLWWGWNIPREEREARNRHGAAVLWFTGYSGSGKTTIAEALERELFRAGFQTMLLDGDHVRNGLCRDLGFSDADRSENIRRVGETAKLFFEAGHIVICAFISPFEKDRAFVRSLLPEGRHFEIHVQCSMETCHRRDPKGLYKRAASGEIPDFTGITSPYEEPADPDLRVNTETQTVGEIVNQILEALHDRGILPEWEKVP